MGAREIAGRFGGGKRPGGKINGADVWPCKCPVHGGESDDSLHLWDGEGGSLGAKCFGGCSYQAVLDAAGVEFTYEGRRHVYGNGGHVNRRRGPGKDLSANYGSNRGLLVKLAEDDAPENAVVLVEGEKAFDALGFNGPTGFTAAHWVGGAGSVEHADYSPLEGREVILWPDAGQVGRDVMAKAAICLHSLPNGVAKLWMVDTEGQPDAADAADVDKDTMAKMLAKVYEYEPPPPVDEGAEETFEQGTGGFAKHSRGLRAIFNVLLLETRVNVRGGGIEVRRKDHGTPEAVALFKTAGLEADPMGWSALTSSAEAHLRDLMERTFRDTSGKPYKHGEDTFKRYVLAMTAGERTDPVQHWLEALPPWDEAERIPTLLTAALGAEDTPLNRAAATAFMVGAIRRTYEPGCQHDWAIVLIGGQGGGKTTFVAEIVPNDYNGWRGRVRNLADDTQKQVESVNNAWIVEFPEMRGTHRLEQIKTYMDEPSESFRPPYGRLAERWPRRWVGMGTANDTGGGVLPDDPSGNRRYVAVLVDPPGETQEERSTHVRAYVSENREQLWAEALVRYRRSEKSYLGGEFEQERDAMNTRYTRANQPLEDIAEVLTAKHADGPFVTLADLLIESELASDLADASEKMQTVGPKLAGELIKRQWYKDRKTIDRKRQTVWYPPRSVTEADQEFEMDGKVYCVDCAAPIPADEGVRCAACEKKAGGDEPPVSEPPGEAAAGDSANGQAAPSSSTPPKQGSLLEHVEARLDAMTILAPNAHINPQYQPMGELWPFAMVGALRGMRAAMLDNPALIPPTWVDAAWILNDLEKQAKAVGSRGGGPAGAVEQRIEQQDWAKNLADLRKEVARLDAERSRGLANALAKFGQLGLPHQGS